MDKLYDHLFCKSNEKISSFIRCHCKENNLKSIEEINEYFCPKIIDIMYHKSKRKKGYLYCLYNKMFESHGTNIYKLGVASIPINWILCDFFKIFE